MDGNYTSGQGQQVTPFAAMALAVALEAALPDIPGENATPQHKVLITRPHRG